MRIDRSKTDTVLDILIFFAVLALILWHKASFPGMRAETIYLGIFCVAAAYAGRIGIRRLKALERDKEVKCLQVLVVLLILPSFAFSHTVNVYSVAAAACALLSALPLSYIYDPHRRAH